jgi:hypothetical protein
MGRFFISCDEATAICDKSQYKESSFSSRLKLTVHMLLCKVCKCYSSQNIIMSKMFGNHSKDACKKDRCLTDQEKVIMEKGIQEKMEASISEK